jgi:ubiquinone/menaquinone biosynthesis C-methylase UbiE
MYVCPHCKGPLIEFVCQRCGTTFPVLGGIPCFLIESPGDSRVREIYDEIYTHHEGAFIDQGRSEPFQRWFSDLVASLSTGPLLEIGCGEGILLSVFRSSTRAGIDPSLRALIRARKRSAAHCAVARAEELPFPSESLDVVVSVGVMEHFENQDSASGEIRRVLTRSGHYVALFQLDMTRGERLRVKAREFLFPLPRPVALAKWIRKKLFHRIGQPLRRSYTIESARTILERNGLLVKQIITQDSHRSAPLAGRHVVIIVAGKAAA